MIIRYQVYAVLNLPTSLAAGTDGKMKLRSGLRGGSSASGQGALPPVLRLRGGAGGLSNGGFGDSCDGGGWGEWGNGAKMDSESTAVKTQGSPKKALVGHAACQEIRQAATAGTAGTACTAGAAAALNDIQVADGSVDDLDSVPSDRDQGGAGKRKRKNQAADEGSVHVAQGPAVDFSTPSSKKPSIARWLPT